MLVDGESSVNAMSERLLKKLVMRLSRPSIIIDMTDKQKVRSLGVVSVMDVQNLLSF